MNNKFFTKKRKIFACNTSREGGAKKGGPRQLSRSPPHKHTTALHAYIVLKCVCCDEKHGILSKGKLGVLCQ